MWAAIFVEVEVVRELIEQGADINTKTNAGNKKRFNLSVIMHN